MGRCTRMLKLERSISASSVCAKVAAVVIMAVSSLLVTMPVKAQAPWPGQPGNLVGYAAAPGWPGAFSTTACPSPTSGTSWSNATVISNCTYSGSGAHTISCNYCIFEYVDFITTSTTANTAQVNGSNILFLGCRFQSNSIQGNNVSAAGSYQYYFYDSFTPLATFYTSPPGYTSWPAAAAGANSTAITGGANAVASNEGYEIGLLTNSGKGPFWVDHCDMWGYGDAIQMLTTTAQTTLTSNWIHDTADPSVSGGSYHTDGIGYLNGGAAPSNVTIIGNAVAMLGNTNALALQAATSGYDNMIVNENFWSGDGATVDFCRPGSVQCTNSTFYGNTLGTDVEGSGAIYSPGASILSSSVWACNTIAVRSGTTWTNLDGWTPTSAMNGQFFINAFPPNSTTDTGGNTFCGVTSPAAINFGNQAVSSSSAGQTITFSNANSGSLSISSITLATGTQFSISSNTCGSTLNSGSSCSITVNFSPTSAGPQTDTLQISDNAPGVSSPQLVPLAGIGTGSSNVSAPAAPAGLTAVIQ